MRDGYVIGTQELRARLDAHFRECERLRADYERRTEVWEQNNQRYVRITRSRIEVVNSIPEPKYPVMPPFPEDCRYMTCGAKTRKGTPCKRIDLYNGCRCRLHGGLSTGPTSEEGKKRSAMNGLRPKRRRNKA